MTQLELTPVLEKCATCGEVGCGTCDMCGEPSCLCEECEECGEAGCDCTCCIGCGLPEDDCECET
jgi:hypothetical protein